MPSKPPSPVLGGMTGCSKKAVGPAEARAMNTILQIPLCFLRFFRGSRKESRELKGYTARDPHAPGGWPLRRNERGRNHKRVGGCREILRGGAPTGSGDGRSATMGVRDVSG